MRDGYVEANGLRFHYRESGDARAPSVLICHGITGHSWEWDTVAAALAERFHVVALDQRGHGATSWAERYAPELLAADIAAVVTALDLGRVRLFGHSMGGISSYLCAARRPELVERLVIDDVGPDSLATSPVGTWLQEALEYWHERAYADPDEPFAEWRSINALALDGELRRYVDYNLIRGDDGCWRWRFDAARLWSFVADAPDPAAQWEAVRQVTCPTLVMRAAESDVLTAPAALRMAHALPRGEVVELTACGHDMHLERPDAFISTVRDFLTAA